MRTFIVVVLVVLSGCASITASRTELFPVSSEPSGAEVRLNGSIVGRTPAQVEIPRQLQSVLIEVTRPGYSTESCRPAHSAGGGWVAPDVVLCVLLFPIGCVAFIDANGAWNELVEKQCSVSLRPLSQSTPAPSAHEQTQTNTSNHE